MSDGPTRRMSVDPALVAPSGEGHTDERPPPRRRGFFKRWLVRLLKLTAALGVLGLAVLAVMYWWYVVKNPGDHLTEDHIQSLISVEAPVYYDDGGTKLGVFFAEEHRQYLPFDSIPRCFVDALVAAEDQDYWEHPGFSARGITRAFIVNLRAGRVVEGGSTLTQQTAKNLFERRGRTYREKLRELANALRLERAYSKERILEFYSNQFYVNGNGRGLAIAAKFFFDVEDMSQLELTECAFLAGVVKSPNRYNPWVPGEERQQRALLAARERTDYVLDRMLDEGSITAEEHAAAVADEISFERGHFRYSRSVVLDEVERELTRPSFQSLLSEHGVGDLGTSALQLTTTLDPDIQRGASYALRHHLTDVGFLLEAPELSALFGEPVDLRPLDEDQLKRGAFFKGNLLTVTPDDRTATVDLGGVVGLLDADACTRLATLAERAEDRNTWAEASRKETKALLEELTGQIGRSVRVSLRGHAEDGTPLLDWEYDAELQGAVVVLEGGEIRAMVGGSSNSDFNRATQARRQLGSTWKPLLFDAALQLRWSSTDPLDNRRAVFPYQGTFYYPRPDHRGAPESVSIAWAATKSENLASIWLLYHLTDRLNPEQLRQVAAQVDLVPRTGEGGSEWVTRVQEAGIIPTSRKLDEGLFDRVREDLLVDLQFDGRDAEADALASMHYGLGFAAELDEVRSDDGLTAREKDARIVALSRSLLRQEELTERFVEARQRLLDRVAEGERIGELDLAGWSAPSAGPGPLSFGDRVPAGYEALTVERWGDLLAPVEPEPLEPLERLDPLEPGEPDGTPDETEAPDDVDRMFAPDPDDPPSPTDEEVEEDEEEDEEETVAPRSFAVITLLDPGVVVLEGQLTPHFVREVRAAVTAARSALGGDLDLYSFELLTLCRDFRTLIGLRYMAALARRAGVRSPIDPVLSMPLGSSDITLLEAAQLYGAMLTGRTHRFHPDALATDATLQAVAREHETVKLEPYDARRAEAFPEVGLIRSIAMRDGRVLYSAARSDEEMQERVVGADLAAMLRTTVAHGTGRRAEGKVRPGATDPERVARLQSSDARTPLLGKTGTTNSYKNSAFVGAVPGLAPGGDTLTWEHPVVIATYVGYDDNREMKRGGIRIQGASGSLPVWIEVARSASAADDDGDHIDLAELAFSGGRTLPLGWLDEQVPVTVDLRTGLPPTLDEPGEDGTTVVYRRRDERAFEPFRPTENEP